LACEGIKGLNFLKTSGRPVGWRKPSVRIMVGVAAGVAIVGGALALVFFMPSRVALTETQDGGGATVVLDDLATLDSSKAVPTLGYRIQAVHPHDPEAYTQGLLYHDGRLYESTGTFGGSSLREVEIETGKVVRKQPLEEKYFAEGMALWGERLFLLTWRKGVAFVFTRDSFKFVEKFKYSGQGWGLTHDGRRLIMSDGTAVLGLRDPKTFAKVDNLKVRAAGGPVGVLNELEYVRGYILANVYRSDRIAVIDPESGSVAAWIDLTGLPSREFRWQKVEVLNGIAWDRERDRLFVTGKLWPRLFEIGLTNESDPP